MNDFKDFDYFKTLDEAKEFAQLSGGKCCPFHQMQLCMNRCNLSKTGRIKPMLMCGDHEENQKHQNGMRFKAYRLSCGILRIGEN